MKPFTLKQRIVAGIARTGPIPFERFMEVALYDPDDGYFSAGPLRSQAQGDFLTSPEVSAEFGAVLARYVEREYRRLGEPSGFVLMEVGAGSGTLLEPLLEALPFTARAMAVEISSAARAALRTRLPQVTVLPGIGEMGRFRGVVIANELVDNLPMAIAVRQGAGWTERWVGAEGEDLILVEAPVRAAVADWLDAYAGDVADGGVVECQLAAQAWLEGVAGLLEAGSILVIDYGDTAAGLLPRRREGTLRTYRSHHLGPHPLDAPGHLDMTADINFTALEGVAAKLGLECRLLRQETFLAELGLADRLADLRHQELEAARSGDPLERLVIRDRVKGIEALLHPRGLGDFRVLVVRP